MIRFIFAACLAAAAMMASPGALADVIFDNGETNSLGGLPSSSVFLTADNFVLAEGENTVTDIHWWGFYDFLGDTPTDNFTVYIYGDDSGAPGAAPLYTFTNSVQATPNGTSNSGIFPEYEYVMNIDPLELTAGTTYWLAISNDLAIPDNAKGIPTSNQWIWSFSELQGGDAHSKLVTAWIETDFEMAFQLTNDGVVPEPASILLIGMGLAGVALRARKRS